MNLAAKAKRVQKRLTNVLEDEDLHAMERDVKVAELNIELCHIRAQQCAEVQAHDEERAWLRTQADFMTKKKVAVAARTNDLIREIAEKQERDTNLSQAFEAEADDGDGDTLH